MHVPCRDFCGWDGMVPIGPSCRRLGTSSSHRHLKPQHLEPQKKKMWHTFPSPIS